MLYILINDENLMIRSKDIKDIFVLSMPKGYWCFFAYELHRNVSGFNSCQIKNKFYFRLGEVLEIVDDLVIDIPKIWTYLAEILCKQIYVYILYFFLFWTI